MKLEFVASVLGSAAGATALLALFVKVTHIVQTKFAAGATIKSFIAKISASIGGTRLGH